MNKLTITRRKSLEWFFKELECGKNCNISNSNQDFLDILTLITTPFEFSDYSNRMIEMLYFQDKSDKSQYSDFQKCLDLISDCIIEDPNYFNWYERKLVVDVDVRKGLIKSLTHNSNSIETKIYNLSGDNNILCCEIITYNETKIYEIKNPKEIIILLNFVDMQYYMNQYAIEGNLIK